MPLDTDLELFKTFVNVKVREPMSSHTTFRTGGVADIMVLPTGVEELIGAINICRENKIPYYIIGNGSNLLVGDKGIRGVVIKLGRDFAAVKAEGNIITACAGALLSAAASLAYREGLTGLEFASGIPGTIGGGIVMNAGAYGGELKDVVTGVQVLHKGQVLNLTNEEAGFVYRGSRIMQEGMTVLSATLTLTRGDREAIRSLMEDYKERRTSKQPLDKPSAGSTFKRPEGDFAGRLIEASGLKGHSIGGAQVSPKHSGFIVNTGGATSKDILTLIDYVIDKVYADHGVRLEPEVRIIGEF